MMQSTQTILRPPTTMLVRADQVRVGDVVGHRTVSVALQLAPDVVAIVIDTPSGPSISEILPDQMIRIRSRAGAA